MGRLKAELDKALDRLRDGETRILHLLLVSGLTSVVVGTNEGRSKFLEGVTRQEIDSTADLFPELSRYMGKYGPREGYWRWARSQPRKVNRLLYQLAAVYEVALFEAFIEDVLGAVFLQEPRSLSSSRTVSCETVVNLGNYDSIIAHLASQRISEVLSSDWHKVIDEFGRLFNVDLSKVQAEEISEIMEIRHAVVHNIGLADQRLLKKVGSSKYGIEYKAGEQIVLDLKTVYEMTSDIDDVAHTIYEEMLDKFKVK